MHHEEGGLCGTAGFKYSSKVEVQLLPLPSAPLRVCPTFSAPSNVFDLSTPASFSSPQPVSPHPPGAPGRSRASWYADRKPHSICHRGRRRKDAIETSPGQKRASDMRAYHLGASVPPRRRHGCADDPDSQWSVRPPRTALMLSVGEEAEGDLGWFDRTKPAWPALGFPGRLAPCFGALLCRPRHRWRPERRRDSTRRKLGFCSLPSFVPPLLSSSSFI